MSTRQRFAFTLLVLLLAPLLPGCTSAAMFDPQVRRQQLLEIYPPGKTTRQDVQQRWRSIPPELSETCPPLGWVDLPNAAVRERALAAERRIGGRVFRVERYWGPDFRGSLDVGGLCNCWFYYDQADKVVDAEWQFHSD